MLTRQQIDIELRRYGMRIRCDTPVVREGRRGVLEFLLLNHPIDCPICDQAGECRLQEYYMGHGLYDARRNVDKVHKPKVVDLGPLVVLDVERCVLCSRCVRFCQEVAKVEELYIKERGHECEIATFPGKELVNPYSGNVVDICPVGALLSKDFRFKSRVWWLKQADSVCESCARGCNIRIDHHWNRVQRIVPRPNPDVNRWWMCDRGRLDYAWINDDRLTEPVVDGAETGWRAALDALCERLSGLGGDFAVLLSPKLGRGPAGAAASCSETLGKVLPPAPRAAGARDDILRKPIRTRALGVRALHLAGDMGRLCAGPAHAAS
jgi:NADH-quinone oxidoreductase subunit G